MGLALGIGKGYQFRRKVVLSNADKYASAVVANGGIVSSKSCVKSTFDSLSNISVSALLNETIIYLEAVSSDGGQLASQGCVQTTFQGLNVITY